MIVNCDRFKGQHCCPLKLQVFIKNYMIFNWSHIGLIG